SATSQRLRICLTGPKIPKGSGSAPINFTGACPTIPNSSGRRICRKDGKTYSPIPGGAAVTLVWSTVPISGSSSCGRQRGKKWTREFLSRLFSDVKPQLRKEGQSALLELLAA